MRGKNSGIGKTPAALTVRDFKMLSQDICPVKSLPALFALERLFIRVHRFFMSLAMSVSGKTFLTLLALQSLNIVFVCFAMPHEVFYPTEALPALCALVTLFSHRKSSVSHYIRSSGTKHRVFTPLRLCRNDNNTNLSTFLTGQKINKLVIKGIHQGGLVAQ